MATARLGCSSCVETHVKERKNVHMDAYHWPVPRIVQPRTVPLCNSHPGVGKLKPIVRKGQLVLC
jgi:hypothetical protein